MPWSSPYILLALYLSTVLVADVFLLVLKSGVFKMLRASFYLHLIWAIVIDQDVSVYFAILSVAIEISLRHQYGVNDTLGEATDIKVFLHSS